ncbi:MAG: transglutaminase-like domain-containing protein [Xanthomonadales bacterium]|nr:transglutaminase-like domain-containing protein [Xanthomonadales bacterium]
MFVGDLLEAVTVRFEAVGEEAVELPELGPVRLLRVEQTMELPGQRLASTLWLDDRGQPRRMRMPLLGSAIDMLACSRACATAPNRVEALFDRALAQAPAGTGALDRRRAWRYRVQAADGEGLDFPSTAEQRARREGETWTIVVRPGESAFGEPKPTPAERSASRWLESDHPELRRFAKAAAGDAVGDAERMRRLERAVAEHIREKSLAVGYASALETLRTRAGDCTEHALLLAAAGRALGIPTRVATGLVYSPAFGEAREVFVPHAWTQAWIGGRWVSFDAAQRGFGGGHLLLAVGDGDPWRFAEGIAQLGRLRLLAVESLPPPGRAATPEAKL